MEQLLVMETLWGLCLLMIIAGVRTIWSKINNLEGKVGMIHDDNILIKAKLGIGE